MTSQSSLGTTRITLQFGLDRDIDGAARDVQAAINAARADLPASLQQNPTYRKVNPADAPIMVLALTSTTRTARPDLRRRLQRAAAAAVAAAGHRRGRRRRLRAAGGARRAQPDGARSTTASASRTSAPRSPRPTPTPQGRDRGRRVSIIRSTPTTRRRKAAQYRDLVIAYRNGAAVRLADVAEVEDSVEDLRNAGLANGKPAMVVISSRQPGANIIEAVDGVKAELPRLHRRAAAATSISRSPSTAR